MVSSFPSPAVVPIPSIPGGGYFWVFLVLLPAFYGQDLDYRDGIIAVVNDDVITRYDVSTFNAEEEKRIRSEYSSRDFKDSETQSQFIEEVNAIRLAAANELVNQKLIYSEFEKKGYHLPKDLVDKRINSIVTSQAGGDWVKFEEMLAASGTRLDELRNRIEKNLSVELLLGQTIDRNINISPDQVESYYKEHESKFTTPARAKLRIIALEKKGSATSEQHRKRVDKVLRLLGDGAQFKDMVIKYSDASKKDKENGGDLGWMLVSDIRPEFQKGFKNIEKNAISEPVELDGITYVINISEIEEKNTRNLDEVYDSIKNKLFLSEKQKRYEEYIDGLRNKSYVRLFFEDQ